jgi:ABC-type lipoprotein release transport system permease subunit
MKTIFTIAWRNIWRNRSRSRVLIAAILVGVCAGIAVSSLSNGMIKQRFVRLIENEIGHVQIHNQEYRKERELQYRLPQPEALFDYLETHSLVAAFTPRTITEGMIQSPVTGAGVFVLGINPQMEAQATLIEDWVTSGDFFKRSDVRNPIVFGSRLAKKLNMEVGNRIVLSFQDIDGALVSSAFTVTGIITSASPNLDERQVFVRGSDLRELLGDQDLYHQVLIRTIDENLSQGLAAGLNSRFDGISAETWYQISPELMFYSQTGNMVIYIVMGVILLALAFGILNTMLMSIHERFREIGMLLAIGMNKIRVFAMITIESVLLTLTGASLGMVFAVMLIWYMSGSGLDLGFFGDGVQQFGFDTVIYPSIGVAEFAGITLLVVITALIAAIYPAFKALRIPPAQAIRD